MKKLIAILLVLGLFAAPVMGETEYEKALAERKALVKANAMARASARKGRLRRRKMPPVVVQARYPRYYFFYRRFPAVGGYVYPHVYNRGTFRGSWNPNTGRFGW